MTAHLVVFDIAGTTVEDPDGVGGSLKAALTHAGIPWKADSVNSVMGIPKPLAIRHLLETVEVAPADLLIDTIHRDFQARMIYYYQSDTAVREVAGAADVFRALRKRHIKVALDTGFDRPIVDVLLKRLGWNDELIDATATSDEVERGRPYPDLIFRLMRQLGVEESATVVKVGDTPSDLLEGHAAGCGMVVGVTSGTHSADLLRQHPHTHLVDSIRDLPGLLV